VLDHVVPQNSRWDGCEEVVRQVEVLDLQIEKGRGRG
jgi:hypothetical protein